MMSTFILIVYLLALLVVCIFSFEAAYLIVRFLKNKTSKHISEIKKYPVVTVQLPIYNEYYVAERLIRSVCSLDYPKEKLEIQVLDDSTDLTSKLCKKIIKEYRDQEIDIKYIHREDRIGYKAGALKEGLKSARGTFIAIFDADFLPQNDFLKRTIPYFENKSIGMVQTRWDHLNENFSLLTRAQAFGLAGHFIIEQNGRNNADLFINFNGTAGVWRKKCIIDAGNWQADTLTEDLDLSYRAQLKGWKFLFIQDIVTPAELPAEVNALKNQQYRWTKGSVETALKILPEVWKSKIPLKQKIHSTFHLTNNMVYPLIFILAILNLPLVMIKNSIPETKIYFFIFGFFIISFFISFAFYSISQKALYKNWREKLLFFPLFMSGSMGLSINNSRAVIEALFGYKTPFIRTPKYKLTATTGNMFKSLYRAKLNYVTLIELFMALYSFIGIIIAVYYMEIGILPFMFLFFIGYASLGYFSVKHYLKK